MTPAREARRFEALARYLEALAAEPRLDLLSALRTPKTLHEIRLPARASRPGETPDRPMSRQAVTRHLEQLMALGLVERLDAGGRTTRGDRFVLGHERLFALMDDLRSLAKLKPMHVDGQGAGTTIVHGAEDGPPLPPAPRLVVAYGRDDGVGYALEMEPGRRWTIGRGHDCDIRLDYDPFLSTRHAAIEVDASRFRIRDLKSRNGTWVDWAPLRPGEGRVLAPGALLTVGRSVLTFQAAASGG